MEEIQITIEASGTLRFVDHHSSVTDIFRGDAREVRTARASRILPCHKVKRIAFRVLRWLVKDSSRVAEWTRTWSGPWEADLAPVDGPVLGPYEERSRAIDHEVRWLNAHLGSIAVDTGQRLRPKGGSHASLEV